MKLDKALEKAILQIARDAGEAIMKVYAQDFAVEYKGDNSPLLKLFFNTQLRISNDSQYKMIPHIAYLHFVVPVRSLHVLF